jgi:hypothetical protein
MVWTSEKRKAYYYQNLEKFKKYSQGYRAQHKHEIYLKNKQYREDNKERVRVLNREYRTKNAEKLKQDGREYYAKNRILKQESERVRGRALRKRQKLMILEHYGMVCNCCGEDKIEFLTVDHINNDGAAHRKSIGGSSKTYPWIIKHDFPDNFQTLCYNCNIAKGVYGKCPHKT